MRTKECAWCGDIFTVKSRVHRFCCPQCNGKARAEHRRLSGYWSERWHGMSWVQREHHILTRGQRRRRQRVEALRSFLGE